MRFEVVVPDETLARASKAAVHWLSERSDPYDTDITGHLDYATASCTYRGDVDGVTVGAYIALARGELDAYLELLPEGVR